MQQTLNPHELNDFLSKTPLNYVMDEIPEVTLAKKIQLALQQAHPYVMERPRWNNWYDQVSRASLSVLLNISQGYGKARGYFVSDFMIARGELYEVGACISCGPPEICEPLKPLILDLAKIVNQRIALTPEKPPTYRR